MPLRSLAAAMIWSSGIARSPGLPFDVLESPLRYRSEQFDKPFAGNLAHLAKFAVFLYVLPGNKPSWICAQRPTALMTDRDVRMLGIVPIKSSTSADKPSIDGSRSISPAR